MRKRKVEPRPLLAIRNAVSRQEREPQLFVSNRRVVESGNKGCPGETLVPAVDVRHFQFCTKRYRHYARIVQSFTCFTRALLLQTAFCNYTVPR